MSRPGRSRPNIALVSRTPVSPDTTISGDLAGTISMPSGALTGTAAEQSPRSVQVVTQPRAAAYGRPQPPRISSALVPGADFGALAATAPQASGALTADVIDAGVLAGVIPMPSGALTGTLVDVPRAAPVLVISQRRPPAYDRLGQVQILGAPVEVSAPDAALAGVIPMPSGALTGVAAESSPRSVQVVTRPRPAAYGRPQPARVTSSLVAGADFGVLAGALPQATGALTADVIDAGVLAGVIPMPSGALTTSSVISGDLAGTAPQASGALTGTAAEPSPRAVQVVTSPRPAGYGKVRPARISSSLVAGADFGDVAGTIPQATGALTGATVDPAALAGVIPMPSGALTTSSVITGAAAATIPMPTGALAGTETDPGALAATAPQATGALTAATYYAATLAGTIPMPTGALVGVERIPGAASGTAPIPVAILAGTITDTGALAGAVPMAVAELNRAPVVFYPLRPGGVVHGGGRYGGGGVTINRPPVLAADVEDGGGLILAGGATINRPRLRAADVEDGGGLILAVPYSDDYDYDY